ncbi:hypothetical protein BHE74_00003422 [Ensete ventricosum]|nr:hypothetical protein BHE74_00003422 [Ensete ventricosum]
MTTHYRRYQPGCDEGRRSVEGEGRRGRGRTRKGEKKKENRENPDVKPFLDLDPTPPSLDDPNPRGNDESSERGDLLHHLVCDSAALLRRILHRKPKTYAAFGAKATKQFIELGAQSYSQEWVSQSPVRWSGHFISGKLERARATLVSYTIDQKRFNTEIALNQDGRSNPNFSTKDTRQENPSTDKIAESRHQRDPTPDWQALLWLSRSRPKPHRGIKTTKGPYLALASVAVAKPLQEAILVDEFDAPAAGAGITKWVIGVPGVAADPAHVPLLVIVVVPVVPGHGGGARRQGRRWRRRWWWKQQPVDGRGGGREGAISDILHR